MVPYEQRRGQIKPEKVSEPQPQLLKVKQTQKILKKKKKI